MSIERIEVTKDGYIYCYDEKGQCTVNKFDKDFITKLNNAELEEKYKKLEDEFDNLSKRKLNVYNNVTMEDEEDKRRLISYLRKMTKFEVFEEYKNEKNKCGLNCIKKHDSKCNLKIMKNSLIYILISIFLISMFGVVGIVTSLFASLKFYNKIKEYRKMTRDEILEEFDKNLENYSSNYLELCKDRLEEIDIIVEMKNVLSEIDDLGCKAINNFNSRRITLEEGKDYHFFRGANGYVDVTNLSRDLENSNDINEVLDNYYRMLSRI